MTEVVCMAQVSQSIVRRQTVVMSNPGITGVSAMSPSCASAYHIEPNALNHQTDDSTPSSESNNTGTKITPSVLCLPSSAGHRRIRPLP